MNKHVLLKEMSTFYILHKQKLLKIEFKTRLRVDKVPLRLTKEQCSAVLDCSTMFLSRYMGDLHLVLPALNVSTMDAGILIMVH